jgi:hypothetical protein
MAIIMAILIFIDCRNGLLRDKTKKNNIINDTLNMPKLDDTA